MNKLSELISKPVVSLFNGREEGVVGNILFSHTKRKALYAIIFDRLEDMAEKVLPMDKIYKINDCILIKNDKDLEMLSNLELSLTDYYNPMLSTGYTTLGEDIGQVTEIVIDDKYNINSLSFSGGETFSGDQIVSFNKGICIVCPKGEKIKLSTFKPKLVMPKSTQSVVHIMNTLDQPKSPLLPNRAIANYRLLLNRKVTKNISSTNGEIIIRQNTKINHATIDIAKRHGLLRELTQYSV